MTENLPVQRYFLNVRHTRNVMLPVVNERFAERKGDWVLYADHLAALRACEQRVREDERSNNFTPDDHADSMTEAYHRGLDAARQAVKHLQHSDDCYYAEGVLCHCEIKRAITAIDALKEKQ